MTRSRYELALEWHMRIFGVTGFETDYVFHAERGWKFDFAWPELMVAAEVDGGRWKAGGGRHMTPDDYTKLNEANIGEWTVLRFLSEMVDCDPAGCVETIQWAIASAR